jgi:hypothetical protein
MAELLCVLKDEQRVICKIRGLLGKYASEIKTDLDLPVVYGENARPYVQLSNSTVKAIVDEDAKYRGDK